jgi:predicted lysophospholipase L1 biosynthesis ABC-type transport system permease subunit
MTMLMMCVLSMVAGVLAVVQAVVHKREQREREEIVWKACLLR